MNLIIDDDEKKPRKRLATRSWSRPHLELKYVRARKEIRVMRQRINGMVNGMDKLEAKVKEAKTVIKELRKSEAAALARARDAETLMEAARKSEEVANERTRRAEEDERNITTAIRKSEAAAIERASQAETRVLWLQQRVEPLSRELYQIHRPAPSGAYGAAGAAD